MLKSIDNDHYLIAVNMDSNSLEAEFHLSDTIVGASFEVLFEDLPQATVVGNVISDHFAGFDVHMYHFQFLDSDSDGLHDSIDNCPFAYNPGQDDSDGDGVGDGCDNCVSVPNPGQQNADVAIDNGPGVSGDDGTVANGLRTDTEGDACEADGDIDNDGLPDAEDTNPLADTGICAAFVGSNDSHANPAGGHVTDDDGDHAPPMGTDSTDYGPSWDTDNDAVLDGAECALGRDPGDSGDRPDEPECGGGTVDTDGDGLRGAWETCGWGTSPSVGDSDGRGDCVEAADVNGDGTVDWVADAVYYAKAALDPSFGKTMDFDIKKDRIVDYVGAVIQEAKFALIAGLCK